MPSIVEAHHYATFTTISECLAPPSVVLLETGCSMTLLLNVILTIIGELKQAELKSAPLAPAPSVGSEAITAGRPAAADLPSAAPRTSRVSSCIAPCESSKCLQDGSQASFTPSTCPLSTPSLSPGSAQEL